METLEEKSEILVVGPGAIGQSLVAYFLHQGCKTYLKNRMDWNSEFLRFHGWGKFLTYKIERPESLKYVKTVFVATKAYDLRKALEETLSLISQPVSVVILSNGYYYKELSDLLQKYTMVEWLVGICNYGVTLGDDNIYQMTSQTSQLWIGPINSQTSQFEKDFICNQKEPFLYFDSDILTKQKRKWFFNVVLNTICAYFQYSRNEFALEKEELLENVFEEAKDLYQSVWNESFTHINIALVELHSFIKQHAKNENSMARDVRLKRTTESQFLAGFACKERHPNLYEMHRKLMSEC